MAMGILAVFDMAGIDVGVNVHRANADRYPPDASYYQADFALHAAGRTRVIYETRPLAAVNESIQEVLHGRAKARIVMTP